MKPFNRLIAVAASAVVMLSTAGMSGVAHAGSTGYVYVTVPGCTGILQLDGGGSSNWATATLDANDKGVPCWLTFYERNVADPAHPISQGIMLWGVNWGSPGSPYYHDSAHQVAIAVSNGSVQKGSDWYN